MSGNTRKPLDFGSLDDFETRPKPVQRQATGATRPQMRALEQETAKRAVDRVATFPSREAADDSQMNIKAPTAVLDRFRAMAKAERYRHGEFLEILMNAYEQK